MYALLLCTQTAAATFLFWLVFPLFRQMILRLGEPQDIGMGVEIGILAGTTLLYAAYWARYRWVLIRAPFQSALIGHLVQFASRISFFFGGALFSALFFRHLPELSVLPTLGDLGRRAVIVLGVLFALFCYSLELDRLGKAIEEPPGAAQ
jgi:hypothetical protein